LQPITNTSEIPTITIDPAYVNVGFAGALAKYVEDKKAALAAARAAMEEAEESEEIAQLKAQRQADNLKHAAIGAGGLLIVLKFLL
jgi:hypothetical protein